MLVAKGHLAWSSSSSYMSEHSVQYNLRDVTLWRYEMPQVSKRYEYAPGPETAVAERTDAVGCRAFFSFFPGSDRLCRKVQTLYIFLCSPRQSSHHHDTMSRRRPDTWLGQALAFLRSSQACLEWQPPSDDDVHRFVSLSFFPSVRVVSCSLGLAFACLSEQEARAEHPGCVEMYT